MNKSAQNIYTIPAGVPFAKALASELLRRCGDDPLALAGMRILLPTRRSCRILQDAFRELGNGRALILPHMHPIGDVDEEELSLAVMGESSLAQILPLPPAITPLKRQLLLTKLIRRIDGFDQGADHALALAEALGQFMDQIHTENLSLKDLHKIVPESFSEHWQITLKFLEILSETWPLILAENGEIDVAQRRNALILALAQHWREKPPAHPVIAAGTTGSIPATAELLASIAALPKGEIILPGLDQDMDDESWNALEPSHPQSGLHHLLQHLRLGRKTDVKPWPLAIPDNASARRYLATEIMRPAATAQNWMNLSTSTKAQQNLKTALEDLHLFECDTEREEALVIALLMRETLETPGKTAALITSDRTIARRVIAACQRWNIQLDDSAGRPLIHCEIGGFLLQIIKACFNNLAPVELLALLKHTLTQPFEGLEAFEQDALRGPRPAPGFEGSRARLSEKTHPSHKALDLVNRLESVLTPLCALSSGRHSFETFLKTHITLAETLSHAGQKIWTGEAGEKAASLVAGLFDHAQFFEPMDAREYMAVFTRLLQGVTVRPAWGTHPRLSILGQLEARLIDADLVILAGLNEGTWPPDPGHDPWMSRSMKVQFGLPSPEKSIGLASHDFVQGFCAQRVALIRARRKDGAPAVPSRWLQRLETVLKAARISSESLYQAPHLSWARQIDEAEQIQPVKRPEPRPPVSARPREITATRVDKWLKDPYWIYAHSVLKLRKLAPLEQEPDAALRGTILHEVLKNFTRAHPRELPINASAILHDLAGAELARHHDDPAIWSFWWPRFSKLCDWYLDLEQSWRVSTRILGTEIKGQWRIDAPAGPFTITARADRIDKQEDGAAIIDYKSTGKYPKSQIESGELPQMPVEALIMAQGGYEEIPALPVASLNYWVLSGGSKPGEVTQLNTKLDEVIENARTGLTKLIEIFDNEQTPYYALPRPENASRGTGRFNDYEHLARVKEWSAVGDSDTGEVA